MPSGPHTRTQMADVPPAVREQAGTDAGGYRHGYIGSRSIDRKPYGLGLWPRDVRLLGGGPRWPSYGGAVVTGQLAKAAWTARPPRLPVTLVWIDAREAMIVRCVEDVPHIERIATDIAVDHRAAVPVPSDPDVLHGGGKPPQTTGEPHDLANLARFVEAVSQRLRRDEDLLVLGPGTVRQYLVQRIRELDDRDRVGRVIECQGAERMTHRQLIACLRRAMGVGGRRLTADEDLLGG
jgi:hypothetical protein